MSEKMIIKKDSKIVLIKQLKKDLDKANEDLKLEKFNSAYNHALQSIIIWDEKGNSQNNRLIDPCKQVEHIVKSFVKYFLENDGTLKVEFRDESKILLSQTEIETLQGIKEVLKENTSYLQKIISIDMIITNVETGKRVGVEIDGQSFHDFLKDSFRDDVLEKRNIDIIRFICERISAKELIRTKCIELITQIQACLIAGKSKQLKIKI